MQCFVALLFPVTLIAQQVSDTSYNPIIENPMYEMGKGSVVCIDEGHHNFHTKDGRYSPFAKLLERDGYNVKSYQGSFEKKKLSSCEILVISNALNKINVEDWYLPNPSAFTEEEIKVLEKWVRKGGSLFLIADHMPMAGAAQDLAAAFGFEFTNGFVFDTASRGGAFFQLEEETLHESIITKGRTPDESVHQAVSFTGQGMQIPKEATPILLLNENCINLLPDTAWVFDESTTQYGVEGWSQAAFRRYGKGRVVVSGEAAMFTAQLAGPQQYKAGMNNAIAPENYKLLLNIIHWLDGKLD